ncbi:MAG: site-2 protease family protein [Firmicutes bacterium]|nr:site-2 protease family protein [Bacillota bacterium]
MLPMILPGIIIAITLHELAHGYVAYALGDTTAKNKGRLSFNPLVHIDIAGFLFLIIAGFGWAKPVPINPMNFKNRKLGTILVSIAGPVTNFLIAIITILILAIVPINNSLILNIVISIAIYNIILGIFNLLPFPPLDGSKIVASLLPTKYEILFYKYQKYLYGILLILILTNGIDRVLGPVLDFSYNIIVRAIFF